MKDKPVSRQGARPGSSAPEVQAGQSSPAGQAESGEVGLADGLPAGWAWADLGSLGDWGSGGTPSRRKPEYYENGTIKWLKIGDLNNSNVTDAEESITKEALENSSAKLVPPDTLLVGMYGSIGKLGITAIECAMNQAMAFCHPDRHLTSTQFLFHRLMEMQEMLLAQGQGGSQQNINQIILRSQRIGLPPKAEQVRIVSAIESLQERSSRAKQALSEARPLLSQLRQSVLRSAFSGRLTERWRTENPDAVPAKELLARIRTERRERWEAAQLAKYEAKDKKPLKNWQKKYKEPEPVDESELEELPESWCWVAMDELVEVQLGQRRAPEFANLQEYPYIRAGNITWQGLDLSEVKTMGFASPESLTLQRGDVLLNEASGSKKEVGKPALWRDEISNCCFQATVVRLRSRFDFFRPEWIFYNRLLDALLAEYAAKTPGVGILHLTAKLMRRWPVPLAPVGEQDRVIALMDEAIAKVDSLEESLASSEAELTRLDQSILAKAFRGELVPQDPRDEPAAKLLARIKQAREAQSSGTKKRPKTVSKKAKKTTRRKLIEVIRSHNGPLTPEALFRSAGFDESCVDQFFLELRTELRSRRIDEIRVNESEVRLGEPA